MAALHPRRPVRQRHFAVLDEQDQPIEGLYAIGNDSGNFFCGNYPEPVVGVAVGRSLTSGYLLGEALTNK